MPSCKLRGIFTVVPTPLKDDESLDLKGLQHLVNHYIDAGCHGLVILGSGGEYPYFMFKEKIQIVKAAAEAAGDRIPIIVGCGFRSLVETREFVKELSDSPIEGFLMALPAYYDVAVDDAVYFYSKICEASNKAILYYHYPDITGLAYPPKELSRILNIDGINGMKESTLNLTDVKEHAKAVKNKDFALFTGTSYVLVDVLKMGGIGAICPIPSLAPKLVIDCFDAWDRGDKKLAQKLQDRILDFLPLMNNFDSPLEVQKAMLKVLSHVPVSIKTGNGSRHSVVKETLRQLGHPITARVRTPLPQITEKDKKSIAKFIQGNEFLEKI